MYDPRGVSIRNTVANIPGGAVLRVKGYFQPFICAKNWILTGNKIKRELPFQIVYTRCLTRLLVQPVHHCQVRYSSVLLPGGWLPYTSLLLACLLLLLLLMMI